MSSVYLMRRMSVASFYWDFYIVWLMLVFVFVFVFMVEVTSAVATAVRNRNSFNLPTPIEHYSFTACSTILRVVPNNDSTGSDIICITSAGSTMMVVIPISSSSSSWMGTLLSNRPSATDDTISGSSGRTIHTSSRPSNMQCQPTKGAYSSLTLGSNENIDSKDRMETNMTLLYFQNHF
jgi:hypothetical protein